MHCRRRRPGDRIGLVGVSHRSRNEWLFHSDHHRAAAAATLHNDADNDNHVRYKHDGMSEAGRTSRLILDVDKVNHLEWRLKRLEGFIGSPSKFEQKRVGRAERSSADVNEKF